MDGLLNKNTKVLLLVAHPDDETIFCGGTMLLYPECQWTVISMTDDGRRGAFTSAIENFKKLGVNIVSFKTMDLDNVPIRVEVSSLNKEQIIWEEALKNENLNPDVVITHGYVGEYGHAAHKLLAVVANNLYKNIYNFVYLKVSQEFGNIKIENKLSVEILKKKTEIFVKNYPSEQYIWKDLAPVMDFEFKEGVEIFTSNYKKENLEKGNHKKKILVIIPDKFVKSTGGIGANSAPIFEKLSEKYDFYVVGNPLLGTNIPLFVKAYKEVFNPFTEVKSGLMAITNSQVRALAEAISLPKPDIVLAFDWTVYLASVETAKYFGVPLIARMSMSPILLSEQGYTFGLNLNNPAEKALHNSFCEMEIRGLKSANRIIQVSNAYKKMYEHIAPNFKDKTRVVLDGIDLDKWQKPNLEKFKFPGTGKKKIIFLGRLSEVKGIISLCQAKVPEEIDLIFIGPKETADKVCMNVIEEKIKNENNVYCLGALYGEDKIRALRSADAIIVPSYHESFGGVALEGLAAGCVVISSRAYGLSDFLNDGNSIYCGTKPQDIEQAYKTFLDKSDEDKEKMRKAGIEMCKTLTIEKAADNLDKVFQELLNI